MKEYSMQQVY